MTGAGSRATLEEYILAFTNIDGPTRLWDQFSEAIKSARAEDKP